MATLTWQKIAADLVVTEAPGCPQARAEVAVREAAIELCRKTNVYRGAPIIVNATNGTGSYVLSPAESQTEVARVLAVLRPNNTHFDYLAPCPLDKTYTLDPGVPQWFAQTDNNRLTLVPTPNAAEQLTVIVSLKPSWDSTGMDDSIAGEHRELIARGALYRILSMSGQPWVNYSAAAANRGLFTRDLLALANRVSGSYVGETPKVVPPAFV